MSVPAWAQERPPAGRPLTVFGPPGGRGRSGSQGRGPSAKRVDTSPRRDRAKLGRTSGLFAAGAWSAREEIARMIENGVPSNEILEAIRSGSEGDQPLEIQGESEEADEPVAKSLSEERPPRSSGVVPPSWTTEKKAEKPAKVPALRLRGLFLSSFDASPFHGPLLPGYSHLGDRSGTLASGLRKEGSVTNSSSSAAASQRGGA